MFFVLSGYLVGGNISIDAFNRQQNWKKYFIDRIVRMWMVLIPALLIGFLLDVYRCSIQHDCYQFTPIDIKTITGNIFFLHTIVVPIFTSNSVLWSLANEFWYYLIFPLLLIPCTTKLHWGFKSLIITILLSVFYWIMPSIIQFLPLWLIGVGVRTINIPPKFKHLFLVPLLYGALALTVYHSNTVHSLISNYLVGLVFSIIILYHKNNDAINFTKIQRPAAFIADFSFSIYAFHVPIMFLMRTLLFNYTDYNSRLTNAGFTEWIIYLLLLIGILSFTYLCYLLSEKHTYKLRELIYKSKYFTT